MQEVSPARESGGPALILLLYWLVATLLLRFVGACRPQWLGRAALVVVLVGFAAFYGVIRVSWTVQVHTFFTSLVVALQLLAACWTVRCGCADRGTRLAGGVAESLETFAWLWVYLAAAQVVLLQSEGSDVIPQLACLPVVALGGAWAFREGRPLVAQVSVGAAWALQAAWVAVADPATLYIPQRTGAWLDGIEVGLPTVHPAMLAGLTCAALGVRVVVGLSGRRRGAGATQVQGGLRSVAVVIVITFLATWGARWMPATWRMPPGAVLTSRELAALLPADARRGDVAYAPALPVASCTRVAVARPDWLYFSNNPECVPDPAPGRPRCVLARNPVPVGEGRILLSHWLPSPRFRSLMIEYFNPGSAPCRVEVRRMVDGRGSDAMGRLLECGTGLWERFVRTDQRRIQLVPPGGVWRQRFEANCGSVMVMGEVTCSAPLVVTTALTTASEAGDEPRWEEPVEPTRGAQTRGVFPHPDEVIDATVDADDPRPCRVTLATTPLHGQDASDGRPRPVVLHGRYGGFTHLRLKACAAAPGSTGRRLLVLMPSGGWTGALYQGSARAVGPWRGLVLANLPVTAPLSFEYDFTLPANSSAPVHILGIPIR